MDAVGERLIRELAEADGQLRADELARRVSASHWVDLHRAQRAHAQRLRYRRWSTWASRNALSHPSARASRVARYPLGTLEASPYRWLWMRKVLFGRPPEVAPQAYAASDRFL
jgi:hypothetical protein